MIILLTSLSTHCTTHSIKAKDLKWKKVFINIAISSLLNISSVWGISVSGKWSWEMEFFTQNILYNDYPSNICPYCTQGVLRLSLWGFIDLIFDFYKSWDGCYIRGDFLSKMITVYENDHFYSNDCPNHLAFSIWLF